MKDPQKKYPASLFWSGVALSILRSFLWLVLSTILLILGRSTPWCAVAGLSLLVLVLAVAIVKQLIYRHTLLHMSDPDGDGWRDATLSPDWAENVRAMVERAMNDDIELPDEYEDDEDGSDPTDGEDGGEGDGD